MSVPSAPDRPDVTEVHATGCTVKYQPPQDDGGAPVTGYVLEYCTPYEPEWIRVNDSPVNVLQFTIVNLTPATDYEFRVAAVNYKGMSEFSPASRTICTVEKPGKPGRPEVIEVIGTSVHLQWTAPDSNGGDDIICYRVEFRQSDGYDEDEDYVYEGRITVHSDADVESSINYTVRNVLQPYTPYTFAVAAVNGVGQGPWSDELEDVTFGGMLNMSNSSSETAQNTEFSL